MSHKFADITFTPSVLAAQQHYGSREQYRKIQQRGGPNDRLGPNEAAFLARRDGFYMASVSETGWPYVQFRGGPAGFLKVLDEKTLGYADFRGNLQYVSVGNLSHDDRVALILMDYPNQTRLKLLGRARIVEAADEPELIAKLAMPEYQAKVERAVVISVEAFDWNCPQHITPRYTEAEIAAALSPVQKRLAALEEENRRLKSRSVS